jgi:ElaB/YqjD/DUF883 family membrane-anchored ribosome-binding protein
MTSARLQREAEVQRVGLSNTLGQLREGMTAQALSGEMMGVARETSLSLVKSLADSARANPGAALLIGAGLTMLLTGTKGGDVISTASSALKAATSAGTDAAVSAAGGVRRAAGAAADTASSMAGKATDTISDAAGKLSGAVTGAVTGTAASLQNKATETVEQLRAKAAGTVDQLRGTVGAEVDKTMGQANEMLHDGQDRARQLQGDATQLAADTKQAMTRLLEEQPILVAAIGTAIGALLGAALPVSQTERSVLGKVSAEAVGAGRDALGKAKDIVGGELASAHLGDKVGDVAGRLVDSMVSTRPGQA